METGKLLHICISARKGIAKHAIPEGNFVFEHGLEGDAHAGDWNRQVSLLAHLDIEFMRSKGLTSSRAHLAKTWSLTASIPTINRR
jgi:hypothetical protein